MVSVVIESTSSPVAVRVVLIATRYASHVFPTPGTTQINDTDDESFGETGNAK